MALNKQFETNFGIDVEHNVIQELRIDRNKSTLFFGVDQYPDSAYYVSGYTGLNTMQYVFNFSVLPASIMTKIGELKSLLETEMINNLPEWSGSTQTQDNGTPI